MKNSDEIEVFPFFIGSLQKFRAPENMNHSLNLLEKQALLEKNGVPNGHHECTVIHFSRDSVIGKPVANGDRDTISASCTVIQRSDGSGHFSKRIPIWRATLLVVNSALGAGILNFPQAYAQAGGIFTALIIHMVRVILYRNENNDEQFQPRSQQLTKISYCAKCPWLGFLLVAVTGT